ncbi:MlaD family protein [Spirosoma fluviale]|uniref:Phospholipid/cholesterol/gamma-HCH transport system substrate-binding protein n=1 Tax=Spirosoma fluviale TaxID=1597977 RepID=A0A286GHJ3_9BACT|nr:MlaD family protein [Spirosoma fluviale]SOD95001.1 phospholipid/cholesterol/gamma-HCH transport system substrate-binding protein [Spirosoma fluviale]
MKVSKEVRVGLLAVISLMMLYFGFRFLKGSDFFSSTHKYQVIYSNIDGLVASNPVSINGLTVGQVKNIEILQDQKNKLLVTLEIKKGIVVTQGTRAVLADDGLLGGKLIRLGINYGKPELADGGMLVAANESGLSALIREKTLPVLNNVDSLTYQLNRVVSQFDQTGIVLNQTLRSANAAVGTLDLTIAENRAGLKATLANVNKLSSSLIETEKQLKPILAKADTFADSLQGLQLKQTLGSVNKTVDNLQKILGAINKGEGSLGKLASDEALYRNVNATTASLEKLLTDLRENPKRYVHFSIFGKKDKPAPATETAPISTTGMTSRVDSTK